MIPLTETISNTCPFTTDSTARFLINTKHTAKRMASTAAEIGKIMPLGKKSIGRRTISIAKENTYRRFLSDGLSDHFIPFSSPGIKYSYAFAFYLISTAVAVAVIVKDALVMGSVGIALRVTTITRLTFSPGLRSAVPSG